MKKFSLTLALIGIGCVALVPMLSSAQVCPTNTICFSNPLKYDSVGSMATGIINSLRDVVVTLAILFIVIGGVMYIFSAGNEKTMTMAKSAILGAVIGLAIVVAAPSLLKEVYTALGGQGLDPTSAAELNRAPSLISIVTNMLNFLLSIVGILAIMGMVVGSIFYLTAAGSEKQIETGKKIITFSIIGAAVAMGSLVIVTQVQNLLR